MLKISDLRTTLFLCGNRRAMYDICYNFLWQNKIIFLSLIYQRRSGSISNNKSYILNVHGNQIFFYRFLSWISIRRTLIVGSQIFWIFVNIGKDISVKKCFTGVNDTGGQNRIRELRTVFVVVRGSNRFWLFIYSMGFSSFIFKGRGKLNVCPLF